MDGDGSGGGKVDACVGRGEAAGGGEDSALGTTACMRLKLCVYATAASIRAQL